MEEKIAKKIFRSFIENMNISFSGLNNIKIYKRNQTKQESFLSKDSIATPCENKYLDVVVHCDLSDDNFGKDLTDFRQVLEKSRPCYKYNCVDKKKPESIDICCSKEYIKTSSGKQINTKYKINNYEVMIDERQVLPLLSFMARITKKVSQMTELSDAQRKYADFVNQSIHNSAVDFIEKL